MVLVLVDEKAQPAARICPATVAAAAPAMPILGKPSRPKMRMGSKMMLNTAPIICVTMLQAVLPVLCSRRSKVISQKTPKEQMSTIRR